jgi:hypothetical protein
MIFFCISAHKTFINSAFSCGSFIEIPLKDRLDHGMLLMTNKIPETGEPKPNIFSVKACPKILSIEPQCFQEKPLDFFYIYIYYRPF